MDNLIITGGRRLAGNINVHGAKNSVLPLISASVLLNGKTVLHNCPQLSDVTAALNIIKLLGMSYEQAGSDIEIISSNVTTFEISNSLMRCMRSSIMFLGSILARCKKAIISAPGGCMLGPRPIDIHIKALQKLGVTVEENGDKLEFRADKGLKGADIVLDFPSVGATENAILAAVLAKGKTTIYNAAREPEIKDLTDFLNSSGAKISGSGTDVVTVVGVSELSGTEHTVIPDRIEAATYMAAAAATGGEIRLFNIAPNHLSAVNTVFLKAGCRIVCENNSLLLSAPDTLKAVSSIETHVYPGFPTDAGPLLIAALSTADGTSLFCENIFENRYGFVNELKKFGADVKIYGRLAKVAGKEKLTAADCRCTDLRGGAALVIAALKADGQSRIGNLCHINRGYDNIVGNLRGLGAFAYLM